jgi:hypothetical protein
VTIKTDKAPPVGHPRRRALEKALTVQIGTLLEDPIITVKIEKRK